MEYDERKMDPIIDAEYEELLKQDDSSIPNINLDPGELKQPTSKYDFRKNLEPHKEAGFKTMETFKKMMYKRVTNKLNDSQKQILMDALVYGLNNVTCAGARDNQYYVDALRDVVGDVEEEIILMKSVINGIFSKTGYYPYNPRQYKTVYMYKHLDKIFTKKKAFNKFLSDIFDVWNQNIEELEEYGDIIPESVCYNKDKWTIYQLLEHFAGDFRRSPEDGNVYSLEDYFYEVGSMYDTNQEAFDDWLKGTIIYDEFAQEHYESELKNIEDRLEIPDEVADYDEDVEAKQLDEDYSKMDMDGGKKKKKKTKKKRR